MKDSIKIFLSYHKESPIINTNIFEPILVGAELSNIDIDILKDNTGQNISSRNPYYCELTGHYWVLKNYLDICNESYIGFAHYRRIPDILNISDIDIPSIFGINLTNGKKLAEDISKNINNSNYSKYDIILPCSCYMYANTVNPLLRDNEPHYCMQEHFKIEHNNNLIDILQNVIKESFSDYLPDLEYCLKSESAHFYNIYIMKKEILKNFLNWKFDIINKICLEIGGWDEKHNRMAGFIGELLINIWIRHFHDLKIGYVPIYMIDYEAEYIEKANEYHSKKMFKEELEVLKELADVATDKFLVNYALSELYAQINEIDNAIEYLAKSEKHSKTAEDFYKLAILGEKYNIADIQQISEYYIKSISKTNDKFYAQEFLFYAEKTHNIDISKLAWEQMLKFDLTDTEYENYSSFLKICELTKR